MMKTAIAFAVAGICTLSAGARSLSVNTGAVSYLFNAADMGRAMVNGENEITIGGCSFAVASITSMQVVETDLADNTVEVSYAGDAATVAIAGNLARYVGATVDGAHVTIAQSALVGDDTCGEITYSLSGTSANGSFTLDGSYKASVDLCGVNLTNPAGAAIDLQNGKRIEVSAKSGSENYLTDGADGSQKAALYCKGHLELKGKGALTVAGNKGHAISAKEYVTVKNLTLTITSAVKDGINCAQYFAQESGSVNISGVGDDGLQVDYKDSADREAEDTGSITFAGGSFSAVITADAAKAAKAEGNIYVSGGTINASVEGGGTWDSAKLKTKASSCLKSDADITISGGDLTLRASGGGGKGISCDGTLLITDGNIDIATTGGILAYVNSTLNQNYTGNTDNIDSDKKSSPKGIKADTFLQIDGGTLNIASGRSEGIESKGELTINGGTIVVYSYDDCINSSSHMNINGGDICAVATNNDALDSNGNLYINGGFIRAFGASQPECGIDANEEDGYTVVFTGGTLLAVGGGNSLPSTSASKQAYAKGNGSLAANSTVQLKSGDTVLAEFTVPSNYSSSSSGSMGGRPGGGPGGPGGPGGSMGGSSVLITCPGLASGTSYTLVCGTTSTSVTAALTGSSGRPW